jgi:hypothetical protein
MSFMAQSCAARGTRVHSEPYGNVTLSFCDVTVMPCGVTTHCVHQNGVPPRITHSAEQLQAITV